MFIKIQFSDHKGLAYHNADDIRWFTTVTTSMGDPKYLVGLLRHKFVFDEKDVKEKDIPFVEINEITKQTYERLVEYSELEYERLRKGL